jgi:hypothetical protein
MIDQSKLKVGDKVCYQPDYDEEKWENGMIKEIPDFTTESVRVVYNCGGNWANFKAYTSALTSLKDLKIGWNQ